MPEQPGSAGAAGDQRRDRSSSLRSQAALGLFAAGFSYIYIFLNTKKKADLSNGQNSLGIGKKWLYFSSQCCFHLLPALLSPSRVTARSAFPQLSETPSYRNRGRIFKHGKHSLVYIKTRSRMNSPHPAQTYPVAQEEGGPRLSLPLYLAPFLFPALLSSGWGGDGRESLGGPWWVM